MFYQIMRVVLLRLKNNYEKIFYATVKSYRTPWPPMIDQLSTEPPELVTLFITVFLKTERHSPSRSQNRNINAIIFSGFSASCEQR